MASPPSKYSEWACLPQQLLNKILDDHLVRMADCIRFSTVCKHWYCVAADNFKDVGGKNQRLHQRQLPFLMVPTPDSSTDSRCLYDVTRKGLYEFQLKIPYNVRCGGCSHGWLIMVADNSFEVTLFNPFSGKSILLPPLKRLLYEKRCWDEQDYLSALTHLQRFEYKKRIRQEYEEEDVGEYVPEPDDDDDEDMQLEEEDHEGEEEEEEFDEAFVGAFKGEFDKAFDGARVHQPDYSIARGALSADPDVNMNGYVLMVIYGLRRRLAFIKSGDENWTYIDKEACDFYETIYADPDPQFESGLDCLEDLICRPNGIFYVLARNGVVFSIDFHGGKQKIKFITVRDEKEMSPLNTIFTKAYLVESPEGGIFRIIRRGKFGDATAEKFAIQKLVDSSYSSSRPQPLPPRKVGINMDMLRDVSFFLGNNHAICVTSSDFSGCQPNSIFFCDDEFMYYLMHRGPTDIGVYHLQDGSITRHYKLHQSQRLMPPPIWISPKFAFPTINICLPS